MITLAPRRRCALATILRVTDVGLSPDQSRRGQVSLRDEELFVAGEPRDDSEPLHHLGRAGGAHCRVGIHQIQDQAVERVGDAGDELRRPARPAAPHLDELLKVPPGVGMATDERVVERGAEGVEIRARIERLQIDALRGAAGQCADELLGGSHRSHGAEVDELRETVVGTADVARAQIAIHHAPRVHERQRRADIATEGARGLPGNGRLALEVSAVEELHRVVRPSGVHAVVMDLDDARMAQLGQREELALEERDRVHPLLGRLGRRETLQRAPLTGRGVEYLMDDGHAALAERRTDAVAPVDDVIPCAGRHGSHAAR
jgi:hypothetical protein